MRILLDTNVVIHRENKRVSNYSIGHLFRWIDKLKYDKVIHPYTISEIQKYRDSETQETISVKLESYAYKLGKVEVFESPKNLSDFGVAVAPQSFVYIKIE